MLLPARDRLVDFMVWPRIGSCFMASGVPKQRLMSLHDSLHDTRRQTKKAQVTLATRDSSLETFRGSGGHYPRATKDLARILKVPIFIIAGGQLVNRPVGSWL